MPNDDKKEAKKLTEQDVKDFAEERKKRCEPVVEKILKEILDRELLLSDMKFVEALIIERLEMMFKDLAYVYKAEIMDILYRTIEFHTERATNHLWGKDKDAVTFKDLDEKLKEAHKKEQQS